MIDEPQQSSNNDYIVIENDSEQIKIKKRDMVFQNTGDHEHHYLPDFTDETDDYIAVVCAKPSCIHGRLVRKEGKDFMKWLEAARTTS